jgi:hypothetical protein
VRVATRSVEGVAAAVAMAAYSYCDTASVATTCSQEAAMVAMAAVRSDRATPTMVSKSVGGGVTGTKAEMRRSGESEPDRV